jgi:hypothetical protein
MIARNARRTAAGGALMTVLFTTAFARAQQVDVGHKIPGTLGLRAGTQQGEGVYVGARAVAFVAKQLVDRHGTPLPVGLDLTAFAAGVGVAATFELEPLSTYVTSSIGGSAAHATASTERPEASIDRAGLGDLFVQPLALGWRLPHADVVASYAFYAPTGASAPGGNDGVGRGHWTHQPALGGAIYFDRQKTWFVSALAGVDINTRKRGIDITRGSTVQVQGGLGTTLRRFFDVGFAYYALWQVTDDSGTELPAAVRGARDRTYGFGPELGLLVPSIRSRLTLRWVHDFASESRPLGQLFLFGVSTAAWMRARQ